MKKYSGIRTKRGGSFIPIWTNSIIISQGIGWKKMKCSSSLLIIFKVKTKKIIRPRLLKIWNWSKKYAQVKPTLKIWQLEKERESRNSEKLLKKGMLNTLGKTILVFYPLPRINYMNCVPNKGIMQVNMIWMKIQGYWETHVWARIVYITWRKWHQIKSMIIWGCGVGRSLRNSIWMWWIN